MQKLYSYLYRLASGRQLPADLAREVRKPAVSELDEILGVDFGPAMIWLCAGLLATVGEGDPEWLFQLDETADADETKADV